MDEAFDFRLEVGERGVGGYQVIARDPGGSVVRSVLDLDPEQLHGQLETLERYVLSSGMRARRVSAPDEAPIQALGGLLFRRLFAGELSGLLRAARNEAHRDGKHIRLTLQVDPPELAGLPWEFLYSADHDEYLARSCLLIRNPVAPTPEQPLRISSPLRVLAMSAAPGTLAALDAAEERERLEAALAEPIGTGHVELHWVPGETKWHLLEALQEGQWNIFHFIGHGDFDDAGGQGFLALCGDRGRVDPLTASQLASALGNHPEMRMVVLNACRSARSSADDAYSSMAAALIRRAVPAVVAMQYEISDAAALAFSRALYSAIGGGKPVDFAVRHAREAVSWVQNGTMEWGTPVLYLRAPDGRIFDVEEGGVGAQPATVTTTAAMSTPTAMQPATEAEPISAAAIAATTADTTPPEPLNLVETKPWHPMTEAGRMAQEIVRSLGPEAAQETSWAAMLRGPLVPDFDAMQETEAPHPISLEHRRTPHSENDFYFMLMKRSLDENQIVRALISHTKPLCREFHWGVGELPSATPVFRGTFVSIHPWTVWAHPEHPLRLAVNFDWIRIGVHAQKVERFAAAVARLPGAAAKIAEARAAQWHKRPGFAVTEILEEQEHIAAFLAAVDELVA